MWMGGTVPLGYDVVEKKLIINSEEAETVRHIYARYLALKCVRKLKAELDVGGYVSKPRKSKSGMHGGSSFSRGALYTILKNPIYIGKIRHKEKLYTGQQEAIIDPSTWENVQNQLANNRTRNRRRTAASEPSLLAGLLYDDQGHHMSPTHGGKRQNRRYRYYVSQALLRYEENKAGSVTRIAAHTIEELVTREWLAVLGNGATLLDFTRDDNRALPQRKAIIEQGDQLASQWKALSPNRQLEIMSTVLKRVTIGRDRVRLLFSRTGVLNLLGAVDLSATNDFDDYRVDLNVSLQRCGIESKLIVAGKVPDKAHKRTIKALQEALNKAMKWNQDLISGEVKSMKALAEKEGVTQRYIAHLIKLAWLSPQIMQAIFSGQVPATLSLDQLKKGFPLDWDEQWRILGFIPGTIHDKAN
jgi:site-specific DNA recombinase